MKIAFNNVQSKPLRHKKQLLKRFSSVLNRGWFFYGRENELLTERLEKQFGTGHVTLVGSGHDSLLLALQAVGCQANDEVIIPANVYPTAFPAAMSGAKVVLADVDQNGLLDIQHVARLITKKTKAIIPVHLYGLVVDIHALKRAVTNTTVKIIEDCAQAFGSMYKNKPVGTLGDIGCFSFYPTKNIGTLGDGGALWTTNKRYLKFFNEGVSYGERTRYKGHFISGHSRLPELQAAALNVYLDMFESEKAGKKKVLNHYKKAFSRLNGRGPRLLYHEDDSDPLIHLLVIDAPRRNALQKYLNEQGIPTHIQYPHPVHKVGAFSHLESQSPQLIQAELLTKRILSLPFHSTLSKNHIHFIVERIAKFYETTS
ncbi:aminotransferase class V-fold PLP-dependent enzyme [Candidatus Microgenomates bacterium]|nr:aminotransferase class V-fold PLP-dependent enzyme [Candidatus Microgenomates bacterium]